MGRYAALNAVSNGTGELQAIRQKEGHTQRHDVVVVDCSVVLIAQPYGAEHPWRRPLSSLHPMETVSTPAQSCSS